MPNSHDRPAPPLPLPLAEKAWLTYQALSESDDLVILLEVAVGAPSAPPLIIGANDAFRRVSGFSNDDIFGWNAIRLFPNEAHAEALWQAIRSNTALRAELTCRQANGGTFMLGLHLMPAPARGPDVHCFVILGRDITASYEARRMQDSIQRLLAKVFTSVDDAVSINAAGGEIMMTNPGYDRLLGYKPNELVGRHSFDVVVPEARAALAETIKEQNGRGRDISYSAPYLRADGSRIVVRVTSVGVTIDTKQFRILTLRPDPDGTPTTRTLSAGRINLVGLDDVRIALGDRWKAVADRVLATAEAVVKRRCGPQDSYSRSGETSFVVCFGNLSEKEAAFRAAMMSREIRNRLIGQGEEPDTAYVRSIAAAIQVPDQADGSPVAHDLLLEGLNQQMERVEQEARQTLAAAWTNATCSLDPVFRPNAKQTVANRIALSRELRHSIMSALPVLPRSEAEAFDLDALMLGLTAQQAITDMGRGVSAPLLVALSFDVFLTRNATKRYLAICQKIDPRIGSRLVLMLSSLPEGLPKARLLDCITRLRPFCGGVGYYVPDLHAASQIELSNSFNPIIAVPFVALSGGAADKVKLTIDSLHARRARLLVYKVGSEKDASLLCNLGADLFSLENQPS